MNEVTGALSYDEVYAAAQTSSHAQLIRDGVVPPPIYGSAPQRQQPPGQHLDVPPIVDEFMAWRDSKRVEQADPIPTTDRFRSALLRGRRINDLPPAEYLIDGVWPARSVSELYGPSGHAKSIVALGMAASVADGRGWCGHTVKPGPVVYVAAEGASGQGVRVDAWLEHYGVDDVPDLIWLPLPVNLTSTVDVTALIDATRSMEPVAFIIDTQARCTVGAEENSAKDMGVMVAACDRIVAELDTAVLLVHHAGKDTSAGLRGSTAVLGAMDAVLSVRRDGDRVAFSIEKMKNGPEDVRHTFKLEPVGDSVVAVEVTHGPVELPDQMVQMLCALLEVDEGNGVASGAWMRASGVAERTFHHRRRKLTDDGYCQATATGTRPRYSLTDKGTRAVRSSELP